MIVGLVSTSAAIVKKFGASIPESLGYTPNYNIRQGSKCLFLSSDNPYEFVHYRYGMTPFWSKEERILYEAPVEGNRKLPDGFLKPGIIHHNDFRLPIREKRGILPVDYFIVTTCEGKPYVIFTKDKNRPIGLGCVWDAWKKDILDPLTYGFSVLTTPAYGDFAKAGIERMPVILYGSDSRKWIKKDSHFGGITNMLWYYDQKLYNAYPLGCDILASTENDKSLITPAGDLVIREKKEEYVYNPGGFKHWHKNTEDTGTWGDRVKKYGG
jgi:putative SOS response-associated peptidase YedK